MVAVDLIGHMEDVLGAVDGGWSEVAVGEKLPFKILRFANTPMAGGHLCDAGCK